MLEAAFWGLVGGIALLLGAAVGLVWSIPRRAIGLVMAFGAGVLISALAFELTAEAYKAGGLDSTSAGLALGSLTFFAGDRVLDRMGGADRKRSSGPGPGGAAAGIVLGAVLDGIPESAAIGVSLLQRGGVSDAVVVAVFLSNVPESLSARWTRPSPPRTSARPSTSPSPSSRKTAATPPAPSDRPPFAWWAHEFVGCAP